MNLSLRAFEFEGGSNLVTPVLIGSRLTRQTRWSHFVNYLYVMSSAHTMIGPGEKMVEGRK